MTPEPDPKSCFVSGRLWALLAASLILLTLAVAALAPMEHRAALEAAYRDGLPLWERPDRARWQERWDAAVRAPARAVSRRLNGADADRRKLVALTFDDGPYPLHTSVLLATLRRHQVPATFFLVGRRCQEFPELTRRIALDGHELANHTFTHRREGELGPGELREETLATEEAMADLTGVRVHLYRPAGGSLTDEGKAELLGLGYTLVDYSVNPGDWWIREPEQLLHGAFRGRSREGVVLLHTGNMSLVRALPTYIELMRAKGFRFVTVSELMQAVEGAPSVNPRLQPDEQAGRLSLTVERDRTGPSVTLGP